MIEIKKAKDEENSRQALVEIFVDGFYSWLKFFSKKKEKLISAFYHIFNLEYFYLALVDGNAAGMVAISDGNTLVVELNKNEFTKNLGFIKGRIAFYVLRKEFEALGKHGMPRFPEVSFVSVLKDYRRMGIGEKMIMHAIKDNPYKEYILEVTDNNTPAIKLYKKLGFEEYKRVPVKNKKQAGFDNYLYLLKRL